MAREPVEAAKRRAMSPARKRRIWEARDGRCKCGKSVPMLGPGVTYDHESVLWFGSKQDVDEDVWPLCDDCNDRKTNGPRGDLARIAKTKRQQKMTRPRPEPKMKGGGRPLRGRGLAKGGEKRPWPKRPFRRPP